MKVEFDFNEFDKFADNLKDYLRYETALKIATQDIAKVLHQHLVEQTPVDTGKLKEMWSAGDNLKFTVETVGNSHTVTLYNTASNNKSPKYPNFKYGLAVNDGHKTPGGDGWVMGKFFVENSITLTYPQVEQIVLKELTKWWDSV